MTEAPKVEKRHAACDECRTRKLKCTGEKDQCSRCAREDLKCVYSLQKPMGRPRKRRREGPEDLPVLPNGDIDLSMNGFVDFVGGTFDVYGNGLVEGSMMGGWGMPGTGGGVGPGMGGAGMIGPGHGIGGVGNGTDSPNGAGIGARHHGFQGMGSVSETTSDYSSISSMISPPGTIPNLMFPPNPSLGNGLPDTKCSCLSNMFLTLSSLGSITSFTFPFVLPQLRAATATAREMVHCTECPKIPATGMQNTFFLGTLVTTIGERYRRVLQAIDEEAASLERAGTTKVFQIEDSSAETLHMHTGNSECGGRFTVDLEPREWQIIAKKVVKMDVLGSPDSKTTLLAVLKQTEDRQTEWHKSPEMDKKREELWGSETLANLHAHGPPDDGDHLCLRIVKQTRAILEAMPW